MTSVQERAEYVARQLDLSGLASLQGYINADTGELRVVDIDTSPPLHAGSHIWAQVLLSMMAHLTIVHKHDLAVA